jgi:hypothetical protein
MKGLVYALFCPIRNKPVYVGQTTQGLKRPFVHLREMSHSQKVNEWVYNLKEDGLSPVIVILEQVSDLSILHEKEQFWILKYIGEGNLLLNQNSITPFIVFGSIYDNPPPSGIGEISMFVRARRHLFHLTQIQLSKKAGVGLRFVRDIEQGTKGNFSTKVLNKVLNVLGGKLTVVNLK